MLAEPLCDQIPERDRQQTRAEVQHQDHTNSGQTDVVLNEKQGKGVAELGLRSVMEFEARVMATKDTESGERIGYGGTFTTNRPTRLGLISSGFGDGYPRTVDEGAHVVINGCKAPVLGRVSMDMLTVDLTDVPGAVLGSTVTLWGQDLPVDDVASWARTIPYELLCKVTTRIPRVPVRDQ